MSSSAVLFDLDGTLADTVGLIAVHIAQTVSDAGVPTSPDAVVPYIGRPLEVPLVDLSGFPPGDPRISEMIDAYRSSWAGEVNERGHELLLPGVHQMLGILREAGHRIGVVTAKTTDGARRLLEAIGIDGDVDEVVGTDLVPRGKPAPDSALLALQRLGAEAAVTWYVGDAASDMEMAKAAGMPGLGITTGASTREELLTAGALAVVDSADEVPGVVLA